jgi:hypothetical protein
VSNLRKISFLFILLCSLSVSAQKDTSFTLVSSYSGDIKGITIDNLNNIYLISSTGQVKKLGPSGDSLAIYNQVRNYGLPYSMDVSNPLKVLLFYKDYSTVVVLDRYLAVRTSIDLRKQRILQPGAIGLSYDNNIWVFDEYDNKLKKVDEQGNLLLETADFRSALNHTILPQTIINDNGSVYLADSLNGIFVFDNYGTFKRRLALNKWQSFEVFQNRIISIQNGFISIYDPLTFIERRQRLPAFQPYVNAFTHANKFILLGKDSVQIYRTAF